MTEYAFTVKINNNKDCLPSDYENIFQEWQKKGLEIKRMVYEKDSQGVCHSHGIVKIPKGVFRKRLCGEGVHFKLEEIYNEGGWTKYIHKESTIEYVGTGREMVPIEKKINKMPKKKLFNNKKT